MNAIELMTITQNTKQAYEVLFQPLAEEIELPQVALDILLFLANNPSYCTARDISRYRHIKPNLISLYVEKLVNKGYLERGTAPADRRQVRLHCTEKAGPIIEKGRAIQKEFGRALSAGLSEEEKELFTHTFIMINENAVNIISRHPKKA